jgi:Recombinase
MPDVTPRPDVLARATELHASGASFEKIARALQAEGYPTPRGGTWSASAAWRLLKISHPHSAVLAPCSVCGDLTASKYGVCHDGPECRRVYASVSTARERKNHPRKPCTSCGQLTTSVYGVCSRPSCVNERMRIFLADQKGAPSVYAVWFPSPCILKIGFSLNVTDSIFVNSARRRARVRNWDDGGSRCIWRKPGDTRTEAWMQATLAFRWQSAYRETSGRICEWFSVPRILTVDEVVTALDGLYRIVPPDLRVSGLAALEPLWLS